MISVQEYILHHSSLNEEEKTKINESLLKNDMSRLAKLIMWLITWSIVAFFIESTLIGGGVVFSIIKGINWHYFLPEFIFLLVNFITKAYFIHWYMKDKISLSHLLYAAVPTIGPGILLGIVVKSNPLFVKALRGYISYRKHSFFQMFKK